MKTQRGRRDEVPAYLEHQQYQPTDVSPLPVLYAGLGLFACVLLAGAITAGFLLLYQHRPPASALEPLEALALRATAPPLQVSEAADRAAIQPRNEAVLHRREWVDRSAGRVRIPIDEAMRLLAVQGWPDKEDQP